MTIYERIKYLRESLNMSQQELAEKVGYKDKSAISKVERGDRDINQTMIMKYAKALGVSPTYILYGKDVESQKYPPQQPKLREGEEELLKLIRLMPDDMKAMYIEALRAALKTQGLM
jgi:transcriptional regulator with XRE-family HTH domain